MSKKSEEWLAEKPLGPKAVYTRKQFRDAYEFQRKEYDWDFAKEREFMENLFCTRFNFLLVVYSLFVTAAPAWQNRFLFVAIAFCGAIACGIDVPPSSVADLFRVRR